MSSTVSSLYPYAMNDTSVILRALRTAGLVGEDETPAIVPLAGGVSCDVFRVALAGGPVCVKQALPRLRVAADWRAPVERIHSEVAWIKFAAGVDPLVVPEVLAEDRTAHLFVMTYFEPDAYPCWKSLLRDGIVEPDFAAAVGAAAARIHGASARNARVARQFANDDLFLSLRIEPYLLYTAQAHPDRAPRLRAIAENVRSARIALMHGDLSPKNILKGPKGPIFLDAETACYGDPAFDLAFCLNHLLLKCVWKPENCRAYCAAFAALKEAYLARADWEDRAALDIRTAELVSALLLARVDGKSPAEYLISDADKHFVRDAARDLLAMSGLRLDALLQVWKAKVERR